MAASTIETASGTAPALDDAWGDRRIAALADVVFNLALEVFQHRIRLTGDNETMAEEERVDAAREFVAELFAPFTERAAS